MSQLMCATGVPPLLGHGRDGHGTALQRRPPGRRYLLKS